MRRDLFAVTESLIEVSVAIATPPIRTAAKAIEYCTSFISTWSAPLLFFLPVSLNSRSQPLIRFCKSLRMVLAGTRTRLVCPDSVFSFRNKCLHSEKRHFYCSILGIKSRLLCKELSLKKRKRERAKARGEQRGRGRANEKFLCVMLGPLTTQAPQGSRPVHLTPQPGSDDRT